MAFAFFTFAAIGDKDIKTKIATGQIEPGCQRFCVGLRKLGRLKPFFLFLFLSAFLLKGYAQDSLQGLPLIQLTQLKDSVAISRVCALYIDSNRSHQPEQYQDFSWQPMLRIKPKGFIPSQWINKPLYVRFALANSSDTNMVVSFFPGISYRSIRLFRINPDHSLTPIKDESGGDGFQSIVVKAGEKTNWMARLLCSQTTFNSLNPIIIQKGYQQAFKQIQYNKYYNERIVGFLLSGVLLMMVLFNIANYRLIRKKEFLYNSLYSLCMFGLIFLTTLTERRGGLFSSFFNGYLSFTLLIIGTIFYIAFTRNFLDTKTVYPRLNQLFIWEEKGLMAMFLLFSYCYFFTHQFWLKNLLETAMKVFSLLIGFVYIIVAIPRKNRLLFYLALGNGMLIAFSTVSFLLVILNVRKAGLLTNAMMYFQLGIVFELIFFLWGLTYKNRIELIEKIKEQEALKLEAEKQIFASKLAVINAQQDERNRISADMHDDLGAGVTAIRLYSELARNRIGDQSVPELDRISNSANELLNNMNTIIWTMNSSNDSFSNMVAYIRTYALEYFENSGIECIITIDPTLEDMPVNGIIRRNVFLVVKEALNNIMKHAKATRVEMNLGKEKDGVCFTIHDNGVGIDLNQLRRFGNGLKNMKSRMEKLNIEFSIDKDQGTLIRMFRKL